MSEIDRPKKGGRDRMGKREMSEGSTLAFNRI